MSKHSNKHAPVAGHVSADGEVSSAVEVPGIENGVVAAASTETPAHETVTSETSSVDGTTVAVPTVAAATEAKGEKGGKAIMLTLADGTQTKRADYIRKRYVDEKASRSEIAKELTALQGKEVPYQIVFAATKGLKGGPDPVPAHEATANAAAEVAADNGEAA